MAVVSIANGAEAPFFFCGGEGSMMEDGNKVEGERVRGTTHVRKQTKPTELKEREAQLEISTRNASHQLENTPNLPFRLDALLQATLSHMTDAVVTLDATGTVRGLNPAAEKLTGWTAQDALGKAGQ